MEGEGTAIHGKFAPMLVPWTVLAPATDRSIRIREALKRFIRQEAEPILTMFPLLRRMLKIPISAPGCGSKRWMQKREKLFSMTGSFSYLLPTGCKKDRNRHAGGSGQVLFGSAGWSIGKPVKDENGKQILYPRVGADNSSESDVPIRLDEDGIPLYDESQRISQLDENGIKKGIFRSYSTLKELVIDGRLCEVPCGLYRNGASSGSGSLCAGSRFRPEGIYKEPAVSL